MEAAGPPRFLGNPCERVLLSDPGGIAHARPLRRRDAAFRPFNNVGSREENISGLYHTTRSLAVSASQPGSPRHHARLASGCWPALPDGVGYPRGSIERFPRHIASSSPKLSWRTKGRLSDARPAGPPIHMAPKLCLFLWVNKRRPGISYPTFQEGLRARIYMASV